MTEYDEINLIDYIKLIFQKKRMILIFILIGAILGWAITLSLPKTYRAETLLEIGRYGQRLDSRLSAQEIISPTKFTEKISAGLYRNYPGLKAEAFKQTNLIRITVTTNNTKVAEDSLSSINELILEDHNIQLEEKKKSLKFAIKELEEKIQSLTWKGQETGFLELEIYYIKSQISDFQPTKIVREPTIVFGREPNLVLNLIFGALLGAFVGIFFILFREWWGKNKEKIKA